MFNNLAASADFLSTWWGLTIFILLDIAVLLLIIALNYRWFFKRALDILFSAVFLVVFFPFFLIFLLADAIYNKSQNAYPALFVKEYCCGKKNVPVRYTVFATATVRHDANGKLLPEEERITSMGRVLRACGMKYYPALLAVLAGGLSFVGPRPMSMADAAAVGEGAQERFSVRPGLVSSLEMYGGEALTYPDMFEEDAEYVAHRGFFHDIAFFMSAIANRIRGEKKRCGVCAEMGYVDWLYSEGEIAQQDIEGYRREGEAKTKASRANAAARKEAESRDFKTFR